MSTHPWDFLRSASPAERRTLLAAILGWMLDGMDVTLYSLVIRDLLRELHLTTSQAGFLVSLTLIASALGGLLFGVLADAVGRRTALMGSILVYSVFTAACGLSRGLGELAAFRVLVGLGMGGEWATGAALVSEIWSPEHRGKALGVMQSGFAIGYALAALIAALVLPRWGWRAVFFAGVVPALITLWIRRGIPESPLWQAGRSGLGVRVSGFAEEVRSSRFPNSESRVPSRAPRITDFGKPILLTLLMNSAALFAWWGLFTWIPTFLASPVSQGGRGLTVAESSLWIVVMQVGMWLGYVTFGFISDTVGRKKTYVAYLLLAAGLVPLYATAHSAASLLVIGPLVAFFGTGHFTGFGAITAELFPTAFRASAMGLTYNFGRLLSAAAPWMVGLEAQRIGLGAGFAFCAVAFFLAALLALFLPETRGNPLNRFWILDFGFWIGEPCGTGFPGT